MLLHERVGYIAIFEVFVYLKWKSSILDKSLEGKFFGSRGD
jgi:hypothetical protein